MRKLDIDPRIVPALKEVLGARDPKMGTGPIRVLVVDDNEAIHEDFRKIFQGFGAGPADPLADFESDLFGDSPSPSEAVDDSDVQVELCHALQGEEALCIVREAYEQGAPFALVFSDIRMPPGMDGVATARRIIADHPGVRVVLCSAYSDHTADEIQASMPGGSGLTFLPKPFDAIAIRGVATEVGRQALLDASLVATE